MPPEAIAPPRLASTQDKAIPQEYTLSSVSSLIRPSENTLSTRLILDPGLKIVRDLTALEQRLDPSTGYRAGRPIFGPLPDAEKGTASSSSLAGQTLISAMDGTVTTGKRGPKEGESGISFGTAPIASGKSGPQGLSDAEDDNADATNIQPSKGTGSSEPDPTGATSSSASGVQQGNVDPDPSATTNNDPTGPGSPSDNPVNTEVLGAIILPELEIFDPTSQASSAEVEHVAIQSPETALPPHTELGDELSLQTAAQTVNKEIRLDSTVGELSEKSDKSPKAKKTRRVRKETDIPDRSNELNTLLTGLLADLDGKGKGDPNTRKLIDDLFGDFEREEYVVKSGDTLESIATFKLKEPRLAPLLYAINREVLGDVSDHTQVKLKPGTVIRLPHFAEILRFRIHVLGDPMPIFVYTQSAGLDTSDSKAANEQLTYTCRLGDTLTSIAERHPLLRNASLWVLLAKVNNLSTEVDSKSTPIAKLKRGTTLTLPSAEEIAAQNTSNQEQPAQVTFDDRQEPQLGVAPPIVRKKRDRVMVNPIPANVRNSATSFAGNSTLAAHAQEFGPIDARTSKDSTINKVPAYNPTARLITQHDLGEASGRLFLRLEVNHKDNWIPVAEYSVTDNFSGLKLYSINGEYREVPIKLPTRAARELAENDMCANALTYCRKFLSNS
jgi:nucleoid-associated protein YgaU